MINIGNPVAWAITGALGVTLGIALFLSHQHGARMERERDVLQSWADNVCTAAGSKYEPPKGKRKAGEACIAIVRDLAARAARAAQATTEAVLQHQDDQQVKGAADQVTARKHTARRERAVQRLEKADASRQGNRVGPDYLRDLNDLAGLRGPLEADPGGSPASGRVEGEPGA